ncbi:unnamed protein product [Rotaria sp. Silwood2]|nr:unnamed protein product [Rotaria sp. Silwood2]CAF3258882.1 unnamed protein product [Rotaria sp. Silwood2]CAF4165690.1 unnamed protein product [Rotaria sp. Silwood2]CAF4511309.1 unnamed protein product [Rotaria sp. Silwood2]
MKATIIIFIFTGLLYFSSQALNCNDNPCELGGYFTQNRGYQCLQVDTAVFCTCPNGQLEIDRPCRVCNRTNPANNPCIVSSTFLACLETDDYGATFACLCVGPSGPVVTTSANCELSVTLTSTAIIASSTATITVPPVTSPTCFNGGYFVDNDCHCPSGFGGIFCEQNFESHLCERIICQNRGVCAIRNPNGPYESVCLCRHGTSGDYCQLNGTSGFCAVDLCMNDAPCQETSIGSTRHAYCNCLPGYNGTKCENQYFKCISNGIFIDSFMNDQGKYFECTQINEFYQLERKSCPKGLRFNIDKTTCTLW